MSLMTSDFDNLLKMKSKWACIDAAIKQKKVAAQNTAREEFYRENPVGRNPASPEAGYGYTRKQE